MAHADARTPITETAFDTIVIGAGQAGPGLASTLAGRGERVALIEADRIGGTCLNSGCRPTKAIRASARAAHMARTSARLGVHVGEVRLDLREVMARKDALIDGWRSHYEHGLTAHESITWIEGRGRLSGTDASGRHRVEVGATTITAPRVIINTGARTAVPPIDGIDSVNWIDHHGALALTELPEHLIVVGGSYIGLELGQIFRRFGSRVTVVEGGSRIVAREDEEISAAISSFLIDEGMGIHCGRGIERVSSSGPGHVAAHLADGSGIEGTHLLLAVGRRPNSDDLGLDTAGVATDARGYITTDGQLATNVDGIYAVGDVNGRGAFTHTSYQDYEILSDVLAGGSRSADGRVATYALFTDPPLGRVGMTERDARAAGHRITVASYPMSRLTRAALDGEPDGLITMVVDADSDRLLGAACLGLHGDEIIQTLSLLMHVDAPVSSLLTWLPIHPTVAEFFPTILAGAG